jgi:hypothetical protein
MLVALGSGYSINLGCPIGGRGSFAKCEECETPRRWLFEKIWPV